MGRTKVAQREKENTKKNERRKVLCNSYVILELKEGYGGIKNALLDIAAAEHGSLMQRLTHNH
jgi:hypothetical protein